MRESRKAEIRSLDADVQAPAPLDASDYTLLQAAQDARTNAYTPYSKFAVGAAVSTKSGAVYTGANMENASYGLTMCAEVGALMQSVASGDFNIQSIAVVGGPTGVSENAVGKPTIPCGRCRQLIFEAAVVSGANVRVMYADANLKRWRVTTIRELLPDAFGPLDLAD